MARQFSAIDLVEIRELLRVSDDLVAAVKKLVDRAFDEGYSAGSEAEHESRSSRRD